MPTLSVSVQKGSNSMADIRIRSSIDNLESYHVEQSSANVVVNANESNYPMPEQIKKELQEQMVSFAFNRYPELQADDLCLQIGSSFGLTKDNVVIGNGSSELLKVICHVFGGPEQKIMVPVPSFSMYGVYVQLAESQLCTYKLTEDGFIDKEAVIAAVQQEQPNVLIICNPNNPTGNLNSLATIEAITAATDCLVVVDEAYLEFADSGSAIDLLQKYDNLICLRTFSKAYGMAGMRCGYGIGAEKLIAVIKKGCLPYGVNACTLMTASKVYQYQNLYAGNITLVKKQREILSSALSSLGFFVYPSAANFVAFYADEPLAHKLSAAYLADNGKDFGDEKINSGKYIFEELKKSSILVRDYSASAALKGCLRVTVGIPAENELILQTLRDVCGKV